MTDETLPSLDERAADAVRYSERMARTICDRLAGGEGLARICAGPGMPTRRRVQTWAQQRPEFGQALERARRAGGMNPRGGGTLTYSEVLAHEICHRLAEGESMSAICSDPTMPCFSTVYRWRRTIPAFAEMLRVAREVQAEKFCDLGWEMAQAATPETAHLTRVRLNQLRWTAGALSPRIYGRVKPSEADRGPKVDTVMCRHFQVEVHPETGQTRVVGYVPDPETMRPVRDSEGEWSRLPRLAYLSGPERAEAEAEMARMKALHDEIDAQDDG